MCSKSGRVHALTPVLMSSHKIRQIQITFRVQQEIVSGLKFVNKFYKAGIRVAKEETMLGRHARVMLEVQFDTDCSRIVHDE